MPLTMVDASVVDFAAVFQRFKADSARKKFVLFLADKDPVSSLSWCPGTSSCLSYCRRLEFWWWFEALRGILDS